MKLKHFVIKAIHVKCACVNERERERFDCILTSKHYKTSIFTLSNREKEMFFQMQFVQKQSKFIDCLCV